MNNNTINENLDECASALQNEETKAEKAPKKETTEDMLLSEEKSTGSSGQISSISLKMISDCVNLVVDQSHIQLSSVIHISKIDNQLNIEHKMVESSGSTARESSSESTEENVINRNSFYNARSLPKHPQDRLNVIVHQPTCSNHLRSMNSSVNSNPGTSSASSNARSNHIEPTTPSQPPPYSKNNSPKPLSAREVLNQLYNGSNASFRYDGMQQTPVMFHHGVLGVPPLQGAPPTYSAVMRIGPTPNQSSNNSKLFNSLFRRPDVCLQPSAPFIAPPRPPPTYAEVQGVSVGLRTPIELARIDQDIQWGPTPLSVSCPNCGNIIMTVVRLHRSNLTHFSALTLCLCGCWPCCLLPYCMKTCKTTYHECPICFTVIGMFTPW